MLKESSGDFTLLISYICLRKRGILAGQCEHVEKLLVCCRRICMLCQPASVQ